MYSVKNLNDLRNTKKIRRKGCWERTGSTTKWNRSRQVGTGGTGTGGSPYWVEQDGTGTGGSSNSVEQGRTVDGSLSSSTSPLVPKWDYKAVQSQAFEHVLLMQFAVLVHILVDNLPVLVNHRTREWNKHLKILGNVTRILPSENIGNPGGFFLQVFLSRKEPFKCL